MVVNDRCLLGILAWGFCTCSVQEVVESMQLDCLDSACSGLYCFLVLARKLHLVTLAHSKEH